MNKATKEIIVLLCRIILIILYSVLSFKKDANLTDIIDIIWITGLYISTFLIKWNE